MFLLYSAVPLVYTQYNFSAGLKGTVFIAVILGASLGAIASHFQDRLYTRDAKRAPGGRAAPESRLYGACVGGICVPISLLWFAWSGRVGVWWGWSAGALIFFNFGLL